VSTLPRTIQRRPTEARVYVYNPSPFADDVQALGDFYHFPPRGVAQCVCAHHSPTRPGGNLGDNQGVHAKHDWPRDEKGKLLTSGRKEVVADAQRVADFIVSEECRGGKGFVILQGTAEEIAEQKAHADATFVAFFLPQVEQTIANWEASVSDYRKNRPGDLAPRQPKVVRDAYHFRDNYADVAAAILQRRKAWVCNVCGDERDSERELVATCSRRHPAQMSYTTTGEAAPNVPARVLDMPRTARPPAPLPPTGPQESDAEMAARLGMTSAELEEERLKDPSLNEVGADDSTTLEPGLDRATALALGGQADNGGVLFVPDYGAARTPSGAVMPAGVVAARQRLQEKNEAAKAGAEVLAAAEKAGFALSVADRKGLAYGDKDVVQDVRARLANHQPPAPQAPAAPQPPPEPAAPPSGPGGSRRSRAPAGGGATEK